MKRFICLSIVILSLFLIGCEKEKELVSLEVLTNNEGIRIDEFKISDLKVRTFYEGEYEDIDLLDSMISTEDLEKLKSIGTHDIHVKYGEKECSFTITLYDEYKVDFICFGEKVSTVLVKPDGDATSPVPTNKEGYRFIGWDKEFTNVKDNLVVTALYEEIFEVKFVDGDNQLGETQLIAKGNDATSPVPINKEGYRFIGWDKDSTNVEEDLVVIALYEEIFEVKFMDGENQIGETQIIAKGDDATSPVSTDKEGYRFIGWDKEFTNVQDDLVINALYIKLHLVVFMDGDTKVEEQIVLDGETANSPEMKDKAGYEFIGWDKEYSGIHNDLVVNSVYKERNEVYKVRFFNFENEIESEQSVRFGYSASAPELKNYTYYVFEGWDNEFDLVTKDIDINPIYRENVLEGYDNIIDMFKERSKNRPEGKAYDLDSIKVLNKFGDTFVICMSQTISEESLSYYTNGHTYVDILDYVRFTYKDDNIAPFYVEYYKKMCPHIFVTTEDLLENGTDEYYYEIRMAEYYGLLTIEQMKEINFTTVEKIPDDPDNIGSIDDSIKWQFLEDLRALPSEKLENIVPYGYLDLTRDSITDIEYKGSYNGYYLMSIKVYTAVWDVPYVERIGDILFSFTSCHIFAYKDNEIMRLSEAYDKGIIPLDCLHKIPTRLVYINSASDSFLSK